MADDALTRWAQNPFFVLGVAPDAPRAEVERAAQKLLGLLGVGAAAAKTYASPFGPRPRTEDLVRQSVAELRDPVKRATHELWAKVPAADAATVTAPEQRWSDAFALFGWRSPIARGDGR